MHGTGRLLGQAFKMRGAGSLLGQALLNYWYRSALGTGPPKCLGQALCWDMPSQIRTCDRLALGTGPTLTFSLRFGMDCDVEYVLQRNPLDEIHKYRSSDFLLLFDLLQCQSAQGGRIAFILSRLPESDDPSLCVIIVLECKVFWPFRGLRRYEVTGLRDTKQRRPHKPTTVRHLK